MENEVQQPESYLTDKGKQKLKDLYEYLVDKREHEIGGWYDQYKAFYSKVGEIKQKLLNRENLNPNAEEDKQFLKELIYAKENGITTRGQSVLSEENFELFIKSETFLGALKKLMREPNLDNFKEFDKAWLNEKKSYNPLLINRVAAACTLDVSTTVSSGKFSQVFDWLIKEKIISKYPENFGNNWFAKNLFLVAIIRKAFEEELKSEEVKEVKEVKKAHKVDFYYLNIFIWRLYENIVHPVSLKKQIIKYGPPGTGKTYQAKSQSELLFNIWKEEYALDTDFNYQDHCEIVQFHPSFGYEDFMEGLKPRLVNGQAQLSLQNGVFKDFCKKAAQWEIDIYHLNNPEFEDLNKVTIQKLVNYREMYPEKLTGKHWEYIFKLEDKELRILDVIPPFFFIIDEINRAELSRVLGELMYCLEYRGVKHCIKTQYSNLNDDNTGMLKLNQNYFFFIPQNIYLIGTMNTIDRSVESFDFALRRRFHWEEVLPSAELVEYHLVKKNNNWSGLVESFKALNDKIKEETLLGPDYQIGHSYFLNLNYSETLPIGKLREFIWEDSLKPLLQEYLRGSGNEATILKNLKEAFWNNGIKKLNEPQVI
ncbi:McrB family protein [Pasteurella multocida]|uniref:McrB family protein n=1 Tax=Pasteurella multocida TaxID=747 RepID=UPI002B4695BF|nr:AAA family ATPase [Pasteurella multocida]WRK03456.1 AAA family ATPase [Pasteurella multocida]HDR1799883.1 AAA family ATPase [Pasteurella multocida]